MDVYIVAMTGVAIIAIGGVVVWMHRGPSDLEPRFTSRRKLLTDAEIEFIRVLELALDGRYRIVTKARLGDVIAPAESVSAQHRAALEERIRGIALDCVLCDPRTFELIAAIQLKDSAFGRVEGEEDRFLEDALHSANMHLVRVPLRRSYTATYLATRIESILSRDFIETLTLMPLLTGCEEPIEGVMEDASPVAKSRQTAKAEEADTSF
jgi:hypothetical protein